MENSATFCFVAGWRSWTAALRWDLAWLDRTEGCGEFSDPHDGDCSDGVAFAREMWKMRVTRAAKASILSVETFPVSGFAVQPAEMLTCADSGKVCRGYGGTSSECTGSDTSLACSLTAQFVVGA